MIRARTAVMLATSFVATAAHARPWSAGMAATIGYGGHADELAFRWRVESGAFVRAGRWELALSLPLTLPIDTSDPTRDSNQLLGVTLASRVAVHVALSEHIDTLVAAGIGHEWLFGDMPVIRPCRLTHACIAGYTTETPSYEGWMPELRVGIGPSAALPNGRIAATFEVIADLHQLEIPPRGERALAILGAVTITLGQNL